MAKFKKGLSGNPAGKAPGTKDKRTELRALLQPHASALLQKAVDMALGGDSTALRMCLDRICPAMKATADPVTSALQITGTLAEQGAAIFKAATAGEITTDEAAAMMALIQAQCRIFEITELEARLSALEGVNHGKFKR